MTDKVFRMPAQIHKTTWPPIWWLDRNLLSQATQDLFKKFFRRYSHSQSKENENSVAHHRTSLNHYKNHNDTLQSDTGRVKLGKIFKFSMTLVLFVCHLLITFVLIGVILLQKGEDAGAGGGSSNPFGARGGRNPLAIVTAIFGALLMINSMTIAFFMRDASDIQKRVDVTAPAVELSPNATPTPAPKTPSLPLASDGQKAPKPASAKNSQ